MFENKKALIVDDEDQARLYLAEILHELFPEIVILFAASPTEAIFMLGYQRVDLILLDVEMPGMSGLELLAALKDRINNTPVIFVSAYKRAEFIQKAMRLNAIDYIDKPINPTELKCAVAKAMSSHTDDNKNNERKKDNLPRLKLFTERGEMFIEPNEIMYFESLKRDAIAYFVNGLQPVVVRNNLLHLIELLPKEIFVRVSRKYIVNTDFIKFTSCCNKTITLFDKAKTIVLDKISQEYFEKTKGRL